MHVSWHVHILTYLHTFTYLHTLLYITLHHITLHYKHTYLHYITLRYVTLRYVTLHYITLYIHTYICFCIPTLHPHPWVMAAMGPWPCPSRPTWLPWRPERGPARRTPPAPRNLTTEMGTANVGWRIQETHDSGDIYVYNAWTYTYIYIYIYNIYIIYIYVWIYLGKL